MKSKLNYKASTYMYMLILFLFIAANFILSRLNIPLFREGTVRSLIPQVVINESIVVFPMLIFLIIRGESIKKVLRFNKISSKQLGLCFILFVCALFISMFGGTLTLFLCKLFNITYKAQSIPVAKESTGLLLSMIFVAVVPAFCEDMFFRGFMLSGCQKKGLKFAVICTGFSFALMHLLPSVFLGIFSIGVILALAVYYTDSIWAGVFIHFCNNLFSTVLNYAVSHSKELNHTINNSASQVKDLSLSKIGFSLGFLAILAAGAVLVVYIIVGVLKKIWIENGGLEKENEIVEEKYPIYKIFNLPINCSIIVFVLIQFLPQIISIIKHFVS